MTRRTRVERLDRLRRKLDAMPPAIARAISTAIEKNATEMAAESRRMASGFRMTGSLERAIGWHWTPANTRHFNDDFEGARAAGASMKGQYKLSADVFAGSRSEGFHAPFLEFGTVNAAPQPFFFPVYRLNSRRYRSRISRAIGKAIREMKAGAST